jgi:DNA-binding Lrp family transcriptional regulator
MQPGKAPGPDRPRRRRGDSVRARLLAARAVRARAETRLPVITRLTSHLVSVNPLDSATRLAAQVFLTVVPLLFLVAAIAPQSVRDHFVKSVHDVFGLTGSADAQLKKVYQGDISQLRQTTGIISVLMVLISATACSRAMQRLCDRAWGLRDLERTGAIRGYRAVVDPAALGLNFEALVFATLAWEDRDTVAAFEEALAAIPQVIQAQRLFGEPDYLLRVATADLAAFQQFYDQRLATLPGVQRLTSTLVMKNVVHDRPLPE